MEKIITIIYPIIFLILLILFLIVLIKRAQIQFYFAKHLFSNKLKNVDTYLQFQNSFKLFNLDLFTIIWIISPIYFQKIDPKNLDLKGKEYNKKLLRNRKQFMLILLTFLLFFVLGSIIHKFFHYSL